MGPHPGTGGPSAGGPTAGPTPPPTQQPRGSRPPSQQRPGGRAREQLRPARIGEIVQRDVETAEPDTPIRTVVAAMDDHDVGSIVVVEDDEPVGMLTDRRIALALETTPDVTDVRAEDLVSEPVVTGSQSMTIYEALEKMAEAEVRRLPIVADDDSLVGIVTLDDLLVVLGTELETATEIIEDQSPRL